MDAKQPAPLKRGVIQFESEVLMKTSKEQAQALARFWYAGGDMDGIEENERRIKGLAEQVEQLIVHRQNLLLEPLFDAVDSTQMIDNTYNEATAEKRDLKAEITKIMQGAV